VKAAFGFIPNLQAAMAESPEPLAGQTALAKMQKMNPVAVIAALRNGTELPDPKLEALHRFATLVVR
jgi:hypothetical protein